MRWNILTALLAVTASAISGVASAPLAQDASMSRSVAHTDGGGTIYKKSVAHTDGGGTIYKKSVANADGGGTIYKKSVTNTDGGGTIY